MKNKIMIGSEEHTIFIAKKDKTFDKKTIEKKLTTIANQAQKEKIKQKVLTKLKRK